MRNNYEVRAEKFIHQIFDYICDCTRLGQFEDAVKLFNLEHHRKVLYDSGLTRICFITSDYVVKIDCGSKKNLNTFGTCDTEVAMYNMAEKCGYAYLLAKPTLIVYKGMQFCIMPRIYGIGKYEDDADHFLTEEEREWVTDHIFDLHNGNYGWKNRHPVIFDYACNDPS